MLRKILLVLAIICAIGTVATVAVARADRAWRSTAHYLAQGELNRQCPRGTLWRCDDSGFPGYGVNGDLFGPTVVCFKSGSESWWCPDGGVRQRSGPRVRFCAITVQIFRYEVWRTNNSCF